MRIAHVTPTYWPDVMRGTERFVNDLATALARRGHEVTVLTGHRGSSATRREEGVEVVRRRRLPLGRLLRPYELHLDRVPGVVRALLVGGYDVAHVHFPSVAWAAALARRHGGPPYAFTLHGMPTRRYLVARRYRLEILIRAIRDAAAVTVGSEAAARPFSRYLLRDPEVIPPGIEVRRFASAAPRAPEPTLVCAASLGDPRKRAALLFGAYERLRRSRPEIRLRVFEPRDPFMSPVGLTVPAGVEVLPPRRHPAELAEVYAASWASVLPAVEEAFGLVLTESLAAGTPVVADTSGAGPEIVDDEAIGRLFAPDDEADLARAMDEALALGGRDGVRERCRRRAEDFDWSALVGAWEAVYARIAG